MCYCNVCACKSHFHVLLVCVNLCVGGMYMYIREEGKERRILGIERGESEHIYTCAERKFLQCHGHHPHSQVFCHCNAKASSPGIPQGELCTVPKSLLLHTLCFGHLPCEGKDLTTCNYVLKGRKCAFPGWYIRLEACHWGFQSENSDRICA